MDQTLSLEQLARKLVLVEEELGSIRQQLDELRRQIKTTTHSAPHLERIVCVDKGEERRWIEDLFARMHIQGRPMGALALQRRMADAGLAPDELSRRIVQAREE